MTVEKVTGQDKGKVILYALSTCGWCKKTKEFLKQLGVAYQYVNVDETSGDEQTKVMEEIKRWNPKCSFPTLVLKDNHCIIGFDEEKIRAELD